MILKKSRHTAAAWLVGAAALTLPVIGHAQSQPRVTEVKPGFNVFSVQQDIEIGRQSAAQAERQLPMLSDRRADRYVNDVVRELAAQAPGERYPYEARIVNASDINAFALPGGPLFVNRGLLESVRSEGELAGVLAHEMAHIALRHGTHNASKAYGTQIGIGVLGGLLGGRSGGATTTSQILQALGGVGLNAVFLKFSRDAETQADVAGAQMMARAGYEPQDMVSFFELLQSRQRSNPSAVSQFFSDHPAPANRAARIRQEAQAIGPIRDRRVAGGLDQVQQELRRYGGAPSTAQILRGEVPVRRTSRRGESSGSIYTGPISVEPPSTRLRSFEQREGLFQIRYPDNWQVYPATSGYGATIAPPGGMIQNGQGQDSIVYGVIINHYDPFEASAAGRTSLSEATDDLVRQITQTNSYLRTTGGRRREQIDGQAALGVILAGRSPTTGEEERVTLLTRELSDGHVLYSLFIAPARDYTTMSRAFDEMMRSLRVDDRAAHR
jgi:Zn-dependent protease with chaperone function